MRKKENDLTPSSTKHEQQLLEEIYRAAQRCRAAKKAKVPRVGIVFAYERKAFIDSTPVTEAESYAHFKIHGRDHHQYWLQLQQKKAVPAEVEYDEVPRGRVAYNTKTRRYTLLLDRCILRNKKLVSRLIAQMNLPSETQASTDSHYRCQACLRRGA